MIQKQEGFIMIIAAIFLGFFSSIVLQKDTLSRITNISVYNEQNAVLSDSFISLVIQDVLGQLPSMTFSAGDVLCDPANTNASCAPTALIVSTTTPSSLNNPYIILKYLGRYNANSVDYEKFSIEVTIDSTSKGGIIAKQQVYAALEDNTRTIILGTIIK